ncbi:MAG: hypothetical protein AAF327_14265, partial [Cyanobacteria bacterium P01_A01_bin.37]
RFSPDGQTLATASSDTTAKLWRSDGSLITTLQGHTAAVLAVRFSPDGQTLATASSDNTVKLWRSDGSLITTLQGHTAAVLAVRFSPDGQTLATASSDTTVKLWSNNLDDLMAWSCDWLHDYLSTNPTVTDDERAACDLPPREPQLLSVWGNTVQFVSRLFR